MVRAEGPRCLTLAVHRSAFVIAVTVRPPLPTLSCTVPQVVKLDVRTPGRQRGQTGDTMSLATMAITGLVAAVVLIVVAITLINKYAN